MKLSVVVGGQYGSEGKGAITGHLAKRSDSPVVAVRVAGPNAGHTVYGVCPPDCSTFGHSTGGPHPWKLRQVPVAAVTNPGATLVIAAGSEIDLEVLESEVASLDAAGYDVSTRLWVDAQATVIDPNHITEDQALVGQIGSTGKGIGAARANRIMRRAKTYGMRRPWAFTGTHRLLHRDHVIVEGTQGYGLGLHAGHYPYCTSSDCRAIDFLSMAGINPWAFDQVQIWVVLRTRPIRVAGNSGPLAGETTWETLGLSAEHTTVTGKVRRVGSWDPALARDAVIANGGPASVSVALTMFDHELSAIAGHSGPYADWAAYHGLVSPPDPDPVVLAEKQLAIYEADCGARIRLIGTGPDTILER